MRMAERITGSDIGLLLRERREAGDSWDTISRDLRVDHGLEVSGDTLRNWSERLESNNEPDEATA